MIKVLFDCSEATLEEMADFYGFPGVRDMLVGISEHRHGINVQFDMVGGELAVSQLMKKIGAELTVPVEYDEYRKLCRTAFDLLRASSGIKAD